MVRYGLIGYPLGHSFSAIFFNRKFAGEGIEARYDLFPLEDIDGLEALIRSHPDILGLNVTIPYKKSVRALIRDGNLTVEAKATGAVNTIRILRERGSKLVTLQGHNTDVDGFRESVRAILSERDDVRRVLLLGANGGAAGAVRYVLEKDFDLEATGVVRNVMSVSDGLADTLPLIGYGDIDANVLSRHLLVVNCTPLGMFPDVESCPPIPYHILSPGHIGFDLIYNPDETLFLRRFREAGATTVNGLEMLYRQAEASYAFWQSGH